MAIDAQKNPKDYSKKIIAQKKADDLIALIRASKEAKDTDKEYDTLIRTAIGNPEYDYEAILQDKAIHDLPIGFTALGPGGIPLIERPKDTTPKMDYYKPLPSNIVEDFDKNKSGIELGPLQRLAGAEGQTDKDFNYKAKQSYSEPDNLTIAKRVYDYVNENPRKKSSYKVEAQKLLLSPQRAAEYAAILKKYKIPKEVSECDPASLAMAKSLIEGESRGLIKTQFDKKAYAAYNSGLIAGRSKQKGEEFTGNIIDNFPNTPLSRGNKPIGSIQNGVVYDNAGNFYTGELRTAYEQLPADLPAILKVANIKLSKDPKLGISVEVKNGVIQSIKQDKSPRIGRQFIENAQKKFGKKGMVFGPQGQQGFIDDPLGILEEF